MRNKPLYIFVGLLVVGAGVVVGVDKKTQPSSDGRLKHRVLADDALTGLDHVEVSKATTKTVLIKDASGVWHLGDTKGFPADASKIARLLDNLGRATYERVAANSKDRFEELGLTTPTHLTLSSSGKDIVSVRLGNTRPGGGQYLSVNDEGKAYLVSQAVDVLPDDDAWELKTLVNIKKDDVKSVAFFPSSPKAAPAITLIREKPSEQLKIAGLPKGSEAKPEIATLDTLLSNLTFTKRYDKDNEEAKGALENPNKAYVTLFDGRTYEILVGTLTNSDTRDQKHFLQINADKNQAKLSDTEAKALADLNAEMGSYFFEVPGYEAIRFKKSRADLIRSKTEVEAKNKAAVSPAAAKQRPGKG